ncbi:MAG: hypothetical protein KDJ37_05270 [Hyphomicrobiaceae bacterium]|nr:hypothetical protein [Hyphomicrobiaceae bacterium]
MKARGWFFGLSGITFASFAFLSGAAPDLQKIADPAALPAMPQLTGIEQPSAAAMSDMLSGLDATSLLVGVAIGFGLAVAGRVSWLDLPRRAIAWLIAHESNFYRAGIAAVCLGVLLFY